MGAGALGVGGWVLGLGGCWVGAGWDCTAGRVDAHIVVVLVFHLHE